VMPQAIALDALLLGIEPRVDPHARTGCFE
jgi:hypothetical protein